jgi:hypothetical protein
MGANCGFAEGKETVQPLNLQSLESVSLMALTLAS